MWNRRKDEPSPAPTSAPPTPSALAKEGIPMSTLPTRAAEPHLDANRGGIPAILGKSVNVKGQIVSREDLTIDGEVEGTVELQEHRLTIGPNGKVMATVKAREVVVLGTLHGNVETRDRIHIRKDAKLVGDIRTARIEIEDGAYFKGNIDIVRTEPKAVPGAQPKPQGVAPAATPVGAGVASSASAGSSGGGAVEIKR
jgi:cytoskeletal protein CcmA (bactofilin family)